MGLQTSGADSQRMAALQLANTVRTTNARTLRGIAGVPMVDGIDQVIALLRDGDEKGPLGSMSIGRLLAAPKGMGTVRATSLLGAASVMSADRKLRRITTRQRMVLAHHLEHPHLLWPETDLYRLRARRVTV
jgi:hypothetical protein